MNFEEMNAESMAYEMKLSVQGEKQ